MSKKASQIFKEFGVPASNVLFYVYPGLVMSVNDGDHHYVDAPKLLTLWGIDAGVWKVMCTNSATWDRGFNEDDRPKRKLIVDLYPDPTGEYDLEKILQLKLMELY